MLRTCLAVISLLAGGLAQAGSLTAVRVPADLSRLPIEDRVWEAAEEQAITLMAQPIAVPRPKTTTTPMLRVRAVHDGKWIAFLLKWADTDRSEAGRLGEFSDAVAIQFPVKDNNAPPPIFMGMKDDPVHIFHWRAQYQADKERGLRSMRDLYPNMHVDIYPMEFEDPGSLKGIEETNREVFAHGVAAGNPQSYQKVKGIDEIFAEGFGTSAVVEQIEAVAHGRWERGEWTVVIARPLRRENGSVLEPGQSSYAGFAVWQGGQDEVGARKSVTMSWTPLLIGAE